MILQNRTEATRKLSFPAAGSPDLLTERRQHLWQKAQQGCLASASVLSGKSKIIFCFREAPAGSWDSGWRFSAAGTAPDDFWGVEEFEACLLDLVFKKDPRVAAIAFAPPCSTFKRNPEGWFERMIVTR